MGIRYESLVGMGGDYREPGEDINIYPSDESDAENEGHTVEMGITVNDH